MMQKLGLYVIGFALLAPVVALAAAAPQDKKTIETCLSSDEIGLAAQCIGIVADPCIKTLKDDDSASTKAKACAARELAVWEEQLADALKATGAGGRDITGPVAQAQKTWRESRDKLCPIFDKIDPGMFVGGSNYCRLHETARRALLLRILGAAVGEH
jgi:Lysozyme inhibitor LprI